MEIVCFYDDNLTKSYLEQNLPTDNVIFLEGTIDKHPEYRNDKAEILCIFVNSCIKDEDLSRFPNLKLIATRSTGFNHICTKTAKSKNIAVCNVPSYGRNTVAEFTFGLLLNLARKIGQSYDHVRDGEFDNKDLQGFDLKNKTLGIIGTGKIGSHIAQIAYGFDMKIIAYDIKENEKLIKKFDAQYVSLEKLLNQSDIITLHAPYNKNTHHIINRKNINSIKKGAYIINTARGGLIETEALVQALKEGIVNGAGLDVLEEESLLKDTFETQLILEPLTDQKNIKITLANHYLIDHPRVIITPHNAFNSAEAIERILECTVKNIEAFKKGNPSNVICK